MKVTLTNGDRRRHDIILNKSALRTKEYGARRIEVTDLEHDGRSGEIHARRVRKAVPGVLTLLAGQRSRPLHPQVLAIPRVARLVEAGVFKVARVEAAAPAKTEQPKATVVEDTAPAKAPAKAKASTEGEARRGGK